MHMETINTKFFNARDLHVRAIHTEEEIKMDFKEIYSKNKKWLCVRVHVRAYVIMPSVAQKI